MVTIRQIALSAAIVLSTAAMFTTPQPLPMDRGAPNNDRGDGDPHRGFATFQQCLADVRGIGGSCGSSP